MSQDTALLLCCVVIGVAVAVLHIRRWGRADR
jgi:hypothetical protein